MALFAGVETTRHKIRRTLRISGSRNVDVIQTRKQAHSRYTKSGPGGRRVFSSWPGARFLFFRRLKRYKVHPGWAPLLSTELLVARIPLPSTLLHPATRPHRRSSSSGHRRSPRGAGQIRGPKASDRHWERSPGTRGLQLYTSKTPKSPANSLPAY